MGDEVPKLTVLITTIAGDRFVREAVRSVVESLPRSSTAMLIFDGAKEDLPEDDFGPDVEVIVTGARGGVARALNLGIRSARSEYIARLDGDDLSKPGRFHAQLEVLERDPTCIAVGAGGDIIDADGSVRAIYPTVPGGDIRRVLIKRNPFIHSSLMLRRVSLEEIGGYDESLMRMQDYDLLLRLGLKGRISVLDSMLVSYRVHGQQNSRMPHRLFRTLLRIAHRRSALSRSMSEHFAVQVVRNCVWVAAQLLRYAGLREAGYQKVGATRPSYSSEEK